MLLPIVLLLASAGPAQQAINAEPTARQFSLTEQNHTRQFSLTEQDRHAIIEPRAYRIISQPGPNRFVNPGRPDQRHSMPLNDEGMILPANRNACFSITAYVFSDGENPELKYVTHCPTLVVPNQTERAHRNGSDADHQPSLNRTAN